MNNEKKSYHPKVNEYVFEKSVEIDNDNLNSTRKSIENERNKAGIIIGFIILVFIEKFDYINNLNNLYFRILIITTLVSSIIFSCHAFVSKKMKDVIKTDKNFNKKWNNNKDFLKSYHDVLIEIIDDQKNNLTTISNSNKHSILLFFIFLILLTISIFYEKL